MDEGRKASSDRRWQREKTHTAEPLQPTVYGHPGINQTINLVQQYYWWPGLHHDAQHYVKGCAECQQNKVNTWPTKAPLQPIFPKTRSNAIWGDCSGLHHEAAAVIGVWLHFDSYWPQLYQKPHYSSSVRKTLLQREWQPSSSPECFNTLDCPQDYKWLRPLIHIQVYEGSMLYIGDHMAANV